MNEQWKNAYREGFADGYAAAKKEMNYTNFPPVYYGGGTPRTTTGIDPKATVSSTQADPWPNNSYAINKPDPDHFITGMSVSSSDC